MNKGLQIFGILMIFLTVLTSVKADSVKFCSDSNGGVDIWTAGIATDEKGPNANDCDGASQNLKEYSCDVDKVKVDNIKCSDYNAVCATVGNKLVGDYCTCAQGYIFDDTNKTCVNPSVPEFGVVAGAIALVGALGIFMFRRK